MKPLSSLLAAGLLLATPLAAQTGVITFEAGMRNDKHLNGTTLSKPFGGIGFAAAMDGDVGKNVGWLLLGSFELRMAPETFTDMNGFVDYAIRVDNMTVGVGLSGQYDYHYEVRDNVLGGSDGLVTTNYPIALGYGAFAKLNFGTNDRTFIQGRYSELPGDFARPFGEEGNSPTAVSMLDSKAWRVGIGQTFDKWIVRVQVIQEQWRFERKFNNANGAYDRDSQILSFGLTRIF